MLNSSTAAALCVANVGYYKYWYQEYRAPFWKKTYSQEIYCSERNYIDELADVVEYLVVLEMKMYIFRQLRELYANTKEVVLIQYEASI